MPAAPLRRPAPQAICGPRGVKATVHLSYHDYVWHSVTTITGQFRGRPIAARMPSP
jgi:hypothetical protein